MHSEYAISPAAAGSGLDLAIDALYGGPYGLLISNVDAGYGSRPWGSQGLTTDAAAFMTVWNMHSVMQVRECSKTSSCPFAFGLMKVLFVRYAPCASTLPQMPPLNPIYAPLLNLVGLNMSQPSPLASLSWYNENASSVVRRKERPPPGSNQQLPHPHSRRICRD